MKRASRQRSDLLRLGDQSHSGCIAAAEARTRRDAQPSICCLEPDRRTRRQTFQPERRVAFRFIRRGQIR